MFRRLRTSDVLWRTRGDRCIGHPGWRRGSVLFEVMLALALFVGAAAFTLAAVQSVSRNLQRSRLQQEAVDFARTKMAELEAGLTAPAGLQGEGDNTSAADVNASDIEESAAPPRWRIDVHVERSEFTDLSLVELTVIENISQEALAAGENPMRYTLRQLVALREDAGKPFENDAIMRGMPNPGGGS